MREEKSVFDELTQIITEDRDLVSVRESFRDFTNAVTLYNFLVLKMLLNLKKILLNTDEKKVGEMIETVFCITPEKAKKIIKAAKRVPDFLKNEDLAGIVVESNRLYSLDDDTIEFKKAIKYSIDGKDRLIKEIENKDRIIAKLMVLWAQGGKK